MDKNYSKNKLPLVQKDEPVKVFFSISISAYPKIDTANSKITTDYDLNLKWYDPRLIFRDLKADETFNDLSAESKMIIWSPKVGLHTVMEFHANFLIIFIMYRAFEYHFFTENINDIFCYTNVTYWLNSIFETVNYIESLHNILRGFLGGRPIDDF